MPCSHGSSYEERQTKRSEGRGRVHAQDEPFSATLVLLLVKDTPRRSVLGVERLLEHAYNATSGVYSECRRKLRDTRESQKRKKKSFGDLTAATRKAQREWVNGDIMHVANDDACPSKPRKRIPNQFGS